MNKVDSVIFVGSKELGFKVLKSMFALAPDRLVACITIDDSKDTRSCFKLMCDFCAINNIKIYTLSRPSEINDVIYSIKPDICFVVGWYFLINKAVMDSIPYGILGIHNSLLPKYRGFAPLVWAIINGEEETGFSLFSFTDKMDEGPIWASKKIKIGETDYISDIIYKIEIEVEKLFNESYLDILDRKITPKKQENILPSYCGKRNPNDGNINWNKGAEAVYNFIRAQSRPYPGAFTYLKGEVLKIWRASIYPNTYYGSPGQVGNISDDGVTIICGDNKAILLEEVELGCKSGKPKDIIKSLDLRLGV